jgi:DNA repair protein RecO (recombination protein O)
VQKCEEFKQEKALTSSKILGTILLMNAVHAVVLRASPFKEYDRILTLFSPLGLMKLFVKGKKKQWLHYAALTSPLTEAEFHYTQGKKDLHRLTEGAILKQNLRIRERFESLVAAERMVQALLDSQWPGKAAPKLYQLFSLFLEHLPSGQDPSSLSSAFLLKIMRHEGLLQLPTEITACSRYAGERYASEAPKGCHFFESEEETLLTELALCRSMNQISRLSISPNFVLKIECLFSQTFN